MYHPGKVVEVFSPKDKKGVESIDNSIQAMLEMWDDNLITVLVEPQLDGKIKKDSIVLVDYRPMQDKAVPRMSVVKVLRGDTAKATWSRYREHHKKRNVAHTPMNVERIAQEGKQTYVG